MITLTLEENQIEGNGEIISDLALFLKNLPTYRDLTLIIKTHDASYHLCPVRKAVPYMKSAEFTPDHWVGEKGLAKGQTFLGGILPTPFMRNIIQVISEHFVGLKGIFVWADLITQAYSPLPSGWTIIWHDQQLLICQDQLLRFSRPCYLPLPQELPAILRYLKRFGYEEEMPITLLTSSPFTDAFPPYIQQEIRNPPALFPQGLTLQVPELRRLHRLYFWPRNFRKAAYVLALVNVFGVAYFGWQIKTVFERDHILKNQISHLPIQVDLSETKMEAFADYRRLSKDRSNPLLLIRNLIPLMKNEAVATYLHWTPNSLTLHLELSSTATADQLFLTLRSQFLDHKVLWRTEDNESLKGVLRMEKKVLQRVES